MAPVRMAARCSATAADVLAFLEGGAGLSYRARRAGNTVTLRTGVSAFSWGETVEVSVVGQPSGCEILFRSVRVHPLNPTANPKAATVRVAQSIGDRFGALQPTE